MPRKAKPPTHPENWPTTTSSSTSIPYLTAPQISPPLPPNILSAPHFTASPSLEPNTPTIPPPSTPYTNVRITPITDAAHPAFGQFGLCVTRDHVAGEFVGLYLGLVHDTTTSTTTGSAVAVVGGESGEGHEKSDYDLSLDRDLGLAVDAARMGNEMRFINDYRGVPGVGRPNAEFRDVLVKRQGKKGEVERGVGVFVKAVKREKGKGGGGWGKGKKGVGGDGGIRKGEEVLVSYGRGFWSARAGEVVVEAEGVEVPGGAGGLGGEDVV